MLMLMPRCVQIIPCAVLAAIAHPGTNHPLVFRVRVPPTSADASAATTYQWHQAIRLPLLQAASNLRARALNVSESGRR